ncbi:M6 family metalloprotease domain-containing protein [Shewanella kaireitica]|uniref:M6 family metalloprotease domain-containing protein n=1 Tax=Shewanella kaireitica TaxID=212021 RepID=UPI0024B20A79|nr:M6 family metalloprotease domain-containing protein [Shewanella kaireitica]
MNKKLKLALLSSAIFAPLFANHAPLHAEPASKKLIEFKQSDGSTVWLRKWGDEFAHGWETKEGVVVQQDELSGDWFVTQFDARGYRKKSTININQARAANRKAVEPRIKGEALRRANLRRTQSHQQNLFSRSMADGLSTSSGGINTTAVEQVSGTVNVPVILVNFADTNTKVTRNDFDQFLFQDSQGLTAYYQEVSYGHLNLQGGSSGVIDWVNLPQTHDFYGRNNSAGYDSNIGVMIEDTLTAADARIDFSLYADINQDCQVDLVSFIYQGNGEHQAVGVNNDIWAHKYSMYWLETEGDGNGVYRTDDICLADPTTTVTINDYFVAPELSNAGTRANVGTFAHEFGHVFGLPDLYDTGGSNSGQTAGAGDWSLMASGSKTGPNRDGESPAHLSAWGKYTLGWIAPTKLNGVNNSGIEVGESANNPTAFLYENPSNPQEYFLIENRDQQGFDAYAPGKGLAIWHIDDAISAPKSDGTAQSDVNAYPCDLGFQDCSTLHNGVQLVSADHYFDLEHDFNDGDIHDLFGEDGDGGSDEYSTEQDWDTEFSSQSQPSSQWWDGSESELVMTNISAKGAVMTFDLGSGSATQEIVLQNGVPVSLVANQGEALTGYIDIPAGASKLQLSLRHNSGGDADLYVNYGIVNDSSSADCFLNSSSAVELCTESEFGETLEGRYFFVVKGYNGQAFADVSLVAEYDLGSEPPGGNGSVTSYKVDVASGSYQHFMVAVPAGSTVIEVSLDESDGSAMLMLNEGEEASARSYSAKDNSGEFVAIDAPAAGEWFVAVRGTKQGVANGLLTITVK